VGLIVEIMQISINNSTSEISLVHKLFSEFAKSMISDISAIQKLSIVIDEVLTNIITHGYRDQDTHVIHISCQIQEGIISLSFEDDGIEFNPLLVEEQEVASELDTRSLGGLGIRLMKGLVDDISYQRQGKYNLLLIKKQVNPD